MLLRNSMPNKPMILLMVLLGVWCILGLTLDTPSLGNPADDETYLAQLSEIEKLMREHKNAMQIQAAAQEPKYASLEDLLRARKPKNPSRRRPSMDTRFNAADQIEHHLQQDGHKIWGWLIYRCTYDDDKQWDTFMQRLRFHIDDSLAFYGGEDLNVALNMTVVENKALFEDAKPAVIREHFRRWAVDASQIEQGKGPMQAQRYKYCLMVDRASLESVLAAPAPPEITIGQGFINLVSAISGTTVDDGSQIECLDDDDEECYDWTKEEIVAGHGVPEDYDWDWMRISYSGLLDWYVSFRKDHAWDYEYRTPPRVLWS